MRGTANVCEFKSELCSANCFKARQSDLGTTLDEKLLSKLLEMMTPSNAILVSDEMDKICSFSTGLYCTISDYCMKTY